MKKKKVRRRRPSVVDFELKDYRGKTIYFNNHGAERMFGTPSPDKKMLALAEKILQQPDWIFRTKPYNLLHLIKRISGKDYLLELGKGYAGIKTNWMLRDFEIIKVKKVERNVLYYDQPKIWRGIKIIHPPPVKRSGKSPKST